VKGGIGNAEPMVETGISFASTERRWHTHRIGLSFDQVRGCLAGPAQEAFDALSLVRRVFLVRAVEEVALCKFRETRDDPDYRPEEIMVWRGLVHTLLGDEGLEGLEL
jgi:hypothetical protein